MDKNGTKAKKLGKIFGFLFTYFLFITIFYMIFRFLEKVPFSLNYLGLMVLVSLVFLFGVFLRRYLK